MISSFGAQSIGGWVHSGLGLFGDQSIQGWVFLGSIILGSAVLGSVGESFVVIHVTIQSEVTEDINTNVSTLLSRKLLFFMNPSSLFVTLLTGTKNYSLSLKGLRFEIIIRFQWFGLIGRQIFIIFYKAFNIILNE